MAVLASDNIIIDTRAFNRFARALRASDATLAKGLRAGLRAAGELVAADARSRASTFSTRIPPTIKTRLAGAKVSVVAGGPNAPHAKPIENEGKGFVRHPVFGNRQVWTAKNSPPAFLQPAFLAHKDEARAAIAEAVAETMHAVGGEF